LLAMLGLATLHTEWSSGWTLLWCCALMLGCGALVLRQLLPIRGASVAEEMDHAGSGAVQAPHLLNEGEQNTAARRWRLSAPAEEVSDAQRAAVWLLGLVSTAVALIAVCELVYLRDIFDSRMNTVFKLYFQAWLLFGLAAAPALALLLGPAWRVLTAAVGALRTYVAANYALGRQQATPSTALALSTAA